MSQRQLGQMRETVAERDRRILRLETALDDIRQAALEVLKRRSGTKAEPLPAMLRGALHEIVRLSQEAEEG